MPGTVAPRKGRGAKLWWALTQGPIRLVTLSSEHNFTVGSPQHEWFATQLRSVDRVATPWIVVALHRPLYESSSFSPSDEERVTLHFRLALEGLLRRYNVDVVLAGHMHNAEITCVIEGDGICAPNAPATANGNAGTTHAVVGTGGAGLFGFNRIKPAWSKTRVAAFGYSDIVANATHFRFTFWENGNTDAAHFTLTR
jgi:acid phosphatase type 7